ncbi:tetratricopeptide repeat protein [Erythrobacteraceae bacterium CFH 75059]|uniref:tetratricopeptide repeat protein n=1 Tax=Qipengyuania thermophila TaxID=2509361 RepID=UPI00102176E5|nr:tetratricopeptide repeat protein [Qipengyuania thermophila]TCD06933.1 tetratricopeptide repeat protein [Erythrobacteraceae bacterium CFH 75059]
MGLNMDEQKAVDRFRKDVVEPSMKKLVVLDFYADWCGPCKALTPLLEKVVGEYGAKGVVLRKIDVDAEQFIAAQFQVRSIPTVYAMFQGQPVADLTPARSESQLRAALDQLLAQLPVQAGAETAEGPSVEELAQFVAMGEQVLADGDAQRAVSIFNQVIDMAADHAPAHAGLIRALIAAGQPEVARAALDVALADPALAAHPLVIAARSAVDLASRRVDDGELAALRSRAEQHPDDAEARYAYAEAAFAAGDRDEAADQLLHLVAHSPDWNEGAARKRLLQIFEAVGLEDPWVVANRRRLSRLLFG